MAPTLLRMKRRRGKSAETYGYDVVAGFKTVGFRSNAPAGPTFVNGIVDESKPIKCHDKAIENTIWGEYEWDINGVNLRGNASDLQRTKGVIEDGQFIIGKNS